MNEVTISKSFSIGAVAQHDLTIICPSRNTTVSDAMTRRKVVDVRSHEFWNAATNDRGVFPGGVDNIKIWVEIDGS